jgi:hypothetical protein
LNQVEEVLFLQLFRIEFRRAFWLLDFRSVRHWLVVLD